MKKLKRFIYTGFYSGYFPYAPGTMGTLVALFIYIGLYFSFGFDVKYINAAIVVFALIPAIILGNEAEKHFGKKDPQEVVLDEMIGFWIALFLHDFNFITVIIAFVLFRFVDIIKPYPIYRLQDLKGGLGIMIDDYIGGLYVNAILWIIILQATFTGIKII